MESVEFCFSLNEKVEYEFGASTSISAFLPEFLPHKILTLNIQIESLSMMNNFWKMDNNMETFSFSINAIGMARYTRKILEAYGSD